MYHVGVARLQATSSAPANITAARVECAARMQSTAHVLLVVFNSRLGRPLREALTRGGHRCTIADAFDWGGRGLDPAAYPVDVVLVDLPYGDADSTLFDADIRRRFPTSAVLVLDASRETARTEPGDDPSRAHSRRVARVRKPTAPEALLKEVDWLLGRSAVATEAAPTGDLFG